VARFLRRKGEFHHLEAELRARRPEPPDALVRRIVHAVASSRPEVRSWVPRFALAVALTLAVFAAFAAVGGPSRAAEAAKSVVKSVQNTAFHGSSTVAGTNKGHGDKGRGGDDDWGSADDEYHEKVKICHRLHKHDKGVTLRLPPNAAAHHLAHHRYDYPGPCKRFH
jgi:hypothetical protein